MHIRGMNSRKSNWLFLSVIVLHIAVTFALVVYSQFFSVGIIENLLLGQLIAVIPAALFLLVGKGEKKVSEELGFRRVKLSTLLLTIVYTALWMPLVTVANAVSMLFVDNTVVEMSSDILSVPFPVMILCIAVIGPFCEETVFRGIVFSGYRREGDTLGAVVLSALVFGFMHMNFNQAGYALVIGIALALLVVGTGSIWPAVFAHFLINAQSVCSMYALDILEPGSVAMETEVLTRESLLISIGIYAVIAAIATALAFCLLVWMSKREGGEERLQEVLKIPEHRIHRITPAFVAAVILALAYMIFDAWVSMLY